MNFKESKPIYLRIADRIMDEILQKIYPEEGRIPSVREYAAEVEVNANTVMRSYEYLQNHEIIFNRRGIGFFVSDEAKSIILSERRESFMANEIDYFFKQLVSLNISAEELAQMYNHYKEKQK